MAFNYRKVLTEGLILLGLVGKASEADAQTNKVQHKKVNSTEKLAEVVN